MSPSPSPSSSPPPPHQNPKPQFRTRFNRKLPTSGSTNHANKWNSTSANRSYFTSSSSAKSQYRRYHNVSKSVAGSSSTSSMRLFSLVGLFTLANYVTWNQILKQQDETIFAEGTDGSGAPSSVSSSGTGSASPRELTRDTPVGKVRHSQKLNRLFRRFASGKLTDGTIVMTPEDFIQSIVVKDELGQSPSARNPNTTDTLRLLFSAADSTRSGYIDFNEFKLLVKLLTAPESEMELAFKMIDTDRKGYITKEQFKRIMSRRNVPGEHTALYFDFDCELMDRFFGKDGSSYMTYDQFAHFMRTLHEEMRRQQFERFDKKGSGFITAQDFARCVTGLVSDGAIPEHIRENIKLLGKYPERVSYAEFDAFNRTVSNIEAITIALKSAGMASEDGSIDRVAFAQAARSATGITLSPIEVGIIFKLFSKDGDDTKLNKQDYEDFFTYMNEDTERRRRLLDMWVDDRASATGEELSTLQRVSNGIFKFFIKVVYGGIAGAVGATFVYPIDLVKTRMQNQRSETKGAGKTGAGTGANVLYKNSFDCFKQVWRHEGFFGFYRGLGPQLMGVGPEKAIKLVVNDTLREFFGDDGTSDSVSLPLEVIAGCGAGASQVVFTNPIEIVKIRLQMAGEIARQRGTTPKGALQICRELGFGGLYKGATACFSRDIPFSGIYFPLYAALKEKFRDEGQKTNTPMQLLAAGSLAGSVAASTTTPMDVIKTRLQVETVEGQRQYNGLFDTTRAIYREEGMRAFWKGAIPRVARSSPQFGVTLLVFEGLKSAFATPEESDTPGASLVQNVPVSEEEQEAMYKAYVSRVRSFTNLFKM